VAQLAAMVARREGGAASPAAAAPRSRFARLLARG
jgi:hypothetical protein